MPDRSFTIALISEVFYQPDGERRLRERLKQARAAGATLAVLPELPLNPWSPATKNARDDDAEAPNGPRWQLQSNAACEAGIGLVGGAIVRDPNFGNGERYNTALIFSANGELITTYRKLHIPEEPGFWETSHYGSGDDAGASIEDVLAPIRGFDMPIGVQICSDINRPEGSHILAALGAKVIIAPRATELATYERWRIVFRANALTSCAYVLSVNRPNPEQDVLIGGPSIAVAPNGTILLETTETLGVVTLDPAAIDQAKIDYPGYLLVRSSLYAAGWNAASSPRNRGDTEIRDMKPRVNTDEHALVDEKLLH